ncbi:MAG: hypothetical protein LUF90_02365 [Rikenellaceae bacterium]|nr:hypothetical protein [Rikenellaceae bacterium]
MRNKLLIAFWGGAILGVATAICLSGERPVRKREVRRMVKQETSRKK